MTDIELPVIGHRKTLGSVIYGITFLVIVISYFISIFIFEDKNHLMGRIFFVAMLVLVIVIFFLPKSTFLKGKLRMNKEFFIYSSDDTEIKYAFTDISDITFHYEGYVGRTRNISMTMYDSGDNSKLTFRHKGLTNSYYLRIESSYLGLIRRLFKEMESCGHTVKVVNSSERQITL